MNTYYIIYRQDVKEKKIIEKLNKVGGEKIAK